MYIQIRRNTHIPTRPTGNCCSLIMTFIMFGTCNFPAHTGRETSQVASAAIINLKNAAVTFIIADANSVLYAGPGIHQQLCAIQPSMGRERERKREGGKEGGGGWKRRGKENCKYSMKLSGGFFTVPPPAAPLIVSRKSSREKN